ncbi:MAG: PepSY domain-containing protein [Opitutaceae bacterium]|nr:PepSY domain-containing protein [Opitutaceae bacterium]
MRTFRQILFWAHLGAGLVAGLSIGIMCFTGAALAFEQELVAWSERDVRRVAPPAPDAPRLPLEELQRRVREAKPDARPTGITVSADPRAAVAFTFGRDHALYADPYTGEVRAPAAPNRVHDFMHVMEDWHRVLALGGDRRPLGKAINGACNLAFLGLAVTGLYLWWPRSLSWRSVRAVAVLNWRLAGKARDFNWHNAIGLWSAPILIVLTITAVPISYRWGGNLIFKLTGETPPAAGQQGPAALAAPPVEVPQPAPGTRPVGYDMLLATVQQQAPRWETISFRLGGFGGRGAGRPAGGAAAGQSNPAAAAPDTAAAGERRPRGHSTPGGRSALTAITLTVKEPGAWPRTATTTYSLNPFTAEVLKTEAFADLSVARQIRSWTRFLHTGQALGWVGQLVAGLACLGGCVLVYTGFALAWRRFFGRKNGETEAVRTPV